ncbi:MAG: hypothetical protein EWM72_01632 [Nitrospira sp.]|nr:MAG: hypothetical protein EWM72_01632 [Nitrospira sp.]
MNLAGLMLRLLLLLAFLFNPLPCLAIPAEEVLPQDLHLNEPTPTTNLVRMVAADPISSNFGIGRSNYPVLGERFRQMPAGQPQ